jgi:hypothetical protein
MKDNCPVCSAGPGEPCHDRRLNVPKERDKPHLLRLSECDCCGKQRRDVQSMGRDSNGDPDAPDMCFLCRKEWERQRAWCHKREKYVSIYLLRDEEEALHRA